MPRIKNFSTFAWFQASTKAATIQQDQSVTGSLSVDKTQVELDLLKAKITFAVDLTNQHIDLTTWGTGDNAEKLYTGVVPSTLDPAANKATVASNVQLGDAIASPYTDHVLILPVTAVLSDTSDQSEQNQTGHAAEWKAAVYAKRSETRKVTFSYDGIASSSILGANEVYFYCASGTQGTYTKASEGVSGALGKRQQLDVTIEQLINIENNAMTSVKAAVTIGYLYVRYEGTERVHTSNSYSVTLAAEAGTGAAVDNANN